MIVPDLPREDLETPREQAALKLSRWGILQKEREVESRRSPGSSAAKGAGEKTERGRPQPAGQQAEFQGLHPSAALDPQAPCKEG